MSKQPSSSFKLAQLDLSKAPAPVAPGWVKQDVYSDPGKFVDADKHAMEVASHNHDSVRHLLYNLVGSGNFNELDKVRILFRWVSNKDFSEVKFKSEGDGTPEKVLMDFKTKKSSFARVFQVLAQNSGLQCEIVNGFAKGAEFKPGVDVSQYHCGHKITRPSFTHSWNAVFVNNAWQFVDCHWATRYLKTGQQQKTADGGGLIYDYDDYYFLTDPKQMIYSHYPDDPNWQLLKKPVGSMDIFEMLPVTKSHFWKNGMEFWNYGMGVIHSKDGYVKITLGTGNGLAYTYKIVNAENFENTFRGVPLARCVFQEMTTDHVNYYFRAPARGSYYLTSFIQRPGQYEGMKQMFNAAVEYKLICKQAATDPSPYPECADSSWGPSPLMSQHGLQPVEDGGFIATSDPHVEIPIKKKESTVDVIFKPSRPGMNDAALENIMKTSDDNKEARCVLDLPEKGEYGVEVYANDPTRDDGHNVYTHVGQYLIRYGDEDKKPGEVGSTKHHPLVDEPEVRQTPAEIQESIDATRASPHEASPIMAEEYKDELNEYADKPGYTFVGHAPPKDAAEKEAEVAAPDPYYRAPEEVKKNNWDKLRRAFSIKADYTRPAEQQVTAPTDFKLDKLERADQPEVVPPPEATDLVDSYDIHTDLFKGVDRHARDVAKLNHKDFKDLMWDLIYSKDIKNEIEKLRAIFLWLCTKDLKAMNFDNVTPGSPEEILMNLKDGRITYSLVFETLCRYGGIHCTTVAGHAKGVDYKPGMKFGENDAQHSWNAALANGYWRLIDCHWAARRIVGKKADENIQYELDEYYFCTVPKQLIYTHFPHDKRWQLLAQPITLADFESLPPVKPQFFKSRLEMISHRHAVIHSDDAGVFVQIGFSRYAGWGVDFSFTLTTEDGRESLKGVKLSQFGLHEVIGKIALFRLRFPEVGRYRLTIFMREVKEDETPQTKGMYGAVIEYGVDVKELSSQALSYPPCSGTVWGFTELGNRYNLEPSDRQAVLFTQNGECEVSFKLSQETLFMAKLKSADFGEDVLKRHLVQRKVDQKVYIGISVPKKGEYGLEIFANNPKKDGKTLFHLCQYLILCDEEHVSGIQYPQLPSNYLGPQPSAADLGLSPLSQSDPYIITNSGQEEISFNLTKRLRMTSNLISADSGKDCSEFILQQTQDSVATFVLRFPAAGMYKLQLFAQAFGVASDSIPGVYNYLIHATRALPAVTPFPKQYQQWKDGCYLREPTQGHLEEKAKCRFDVTVPGAQKVAVLVGEEWHHLEKVDEEGRHDGLMSVSPSQRVALLANYGGDESNYSTLLEYNV